MDHFGIGAALQCMVRTYSFSARQTGRTTSMVDSVKSGDRIIFCNGPEAKRVERLCRERHLTVTCVVIDPKHPHELFTMATSADEGRTLFDHNWVEKFYALAIERAAADIDHFQRESSGYGEAHRATRRRAEAAMRFPPC